MRQKNIFKLIFALLAVMLAILPFMVSFNDILTQVVERIGAYLWIQRVIVPWEVRMVGVTVRPLGIDYLAHPEGMSVNGVYAKLSWNCIGWQSLLLLIITFAFGLRGSYTLLSKIEVVLIGLLGTFLVNILRMTITVIILAVSRPLFAVVYHDYLAAIMTILWLVGFWWFSYSFVLLPKEQGS
ncbi:hypothetical protein AMJ51_01200 [Microgenomates bacterium DG_75]|nr:MAG: hypothetical protein AMJ51_01200 [Microgenomates bacterium DG_75]